jgi:hypothetical protein
MSDKKYWKTTIVFEVLTEGGTALPDDMGLEDIIDMTINGHASGDVKSLVSEQVDRQTMADLLEDQRSDPAFLIEDWEDEDTLQIIERCAHSTRSKATGECLDCGDD